MHDALDQQRDQMHHESGAVKRLGFAKWELVVVLAIMVVLAAFLLPAVERSRGPARLVQCKNNLKQIGLALHNYHDVYDAFPPACTVDADGRPLHSWRTLILPYVDQQVLYDSIDLSKPWDDPANATARETTLNVYQCPSVAEVPSGHTTYLGVVGADRCFSPTESRQLSEFAYTSETLMAIEVPADNAIHWMAPQDDDGTLFQLLSETTEVSHAGGVHTLFVDGSVSFVDADMKSNERQKLLSVAK